MRLLFFLSMLLFGSQLSAQSNCHIFDLVVESVDCANGQFFAVLTFHHEQTSDQFTVQGNGVSYGTFAYTQNPTTITLGPLAANGTTNYEFVVRDLQNPDCQDSYDLGTVSCNSNPPCEIFNLTVETGDCNSDGTYHATINFEVQSPTSDHFDVWTDGTYYGSFGLGDLPLHIEHFPNNPNSPNDYVKVCMNDNDDCCRIKEFAAPDCTPVGGTCEIYDLTAVAGDCNDDGTYHLTVNFGVHNPGNDFFEVWANNGAYLGIFPLSSLPLHIEHFPGDGNGPHDVVKVCINDHPDCCKTLEFDAPDCDPAQGDCNVHHIVVETGDCNPDGTYHLTVNFQVQFPTDDQFDVWANNNQYVGTYNLADLPLHIANFPTDGGPNDRIKICINDDPSCCRARNFPAPHCPGNPCEIWNLEVTTTPCICGQFFALVKFKSKNGGADGFDIMGNGQNYGNYPYGTALPIVIGPLMGDSLTNYEFIVKDHNNPDCHDSFDLGLVDCDDNFQSPPTTRRAIRHIAPSSLSLSPNPAGDRLQVMALTPVGSRVGVATVEIFRADGRLVRTETVSEGDAFSLEVAGLTPGVYRLRVVGAIGAMTGDFVKQ